MRSGSTRSVNKNTKPFLSDGTSLLQNRLLQLMDVECDEIIVSTNCEICVEQSLEIGQYESRVKVIKRPESLCLPETKVSDIMTHIASVCASEVVMWTHVTSPFISTADLSEAFDIFEDENEFDSVVSANKIQNFLWDKDNKCVVNNFNPKNKWPNTQDLFPLYEFNHAFYICEKKLLNSGERVGKNPFLYECFEDAKIDIDWERDFSYAQKIAQHNDCVRKIIDLTGRV